MSPVVTWRERPIVNISSIILLAIFAKSFAKNVVFRPRTAAGALQLENAEMLWRRESAPEPEAAAGGAVSPMRPAG